MSRPRRHLRWGVPRRAPRARLERLARPVAPDTQGPLYQCCTRAMERAVRLREAGCTVVAVAALPMERVLWRASDRAFSHGATA